MYLAIYICAIVLAAALIVTGFVLVAKSDKKRKDDFKAQREKEEIANLPKFELPQEKPIEPQIAEEHLEEFSLDEVDKIFEKHPETQQDGDRSEESSKKAFDKTFVEYEKFLRENLNDDDDNDLDEDDFDDEEDKEIQSIMNFDFNSIKGKSKEEILEMTKDLPKRTRELILASALDIDDDDED